MQPSEEDLLKRYAAKYMWWKPAEEAMQLSEPIIAQVMNISDYEDAQTNAGGGLQKEPLLFSRISVGFIFLTVIK
jgi:hypothetical protein